MRTKRVERAIKLAEKAHSGQFRATGEPYIVHPKAVLKILEGWGMDEDTLVAGVLHDTVEDTDLTLDDIKDEFGESVAFLVDGVTKLGSARKGMRDIDTYLPETKDNLIRLLVALGADIRVLIIKLADRLHNMRTLSALSPDRQKKIAKETLEIFAPLADRLNMGQLRVEMADLAFSYVDPERFHYLQDLIRTRNKSAERVMKKAENEIGAALKREKIHFSASYREKSVYSLHKKLAKFDQNINEIYDLNALRYVVDDITSCYLVLGVIHSLYTPMNGRIKDYIAQPKTNGYQSLHTTVITPDKAIIEFQIRTKEMHEYAERGLAASFYYNEQKLTENYRTGKIQHLPTNLLWISELQTAAARLREGKKIDKEKLKLHIFSDEIFVYTPKGDIVDLPVGSMPLDFAYKLHSEIGGHVSGAIVNGKMVSLNTKLEQGDIVEILTSKNQVPNESWLSKIVSKHARVKLKQQLSHLEDQQH
jgi:GTP pyrophosphokinase